MHRRDFLKLALAGAASQFARESSAEEKPQELDINTTLKTIAETVRAHPLCADVQEHLVPNPTIGLTQWRWWHFRHDIDEQQFPKVEAVNAELLPAFHAVHAVPNAGLDALLQEGFIEGKVQTHIADYQRTHRELVELQCTIHIPFGGTVLPKPMAVENELRNHTRLSTPVNHFVYPYGNQRQVRISPLGRFGAGYFLSEQKNVELLAAEDPDLDAKAEWAEVHGTPEEYKKLVLDDRDVHFISIVRQSKRKMMHLLVGAAHDLTDDIKTNNAANPEQISHIVISVKSLSQPEKDEKKQPEAAK